LKKINKSWNIPEISAATVQQVAQDVYADCIITILDKKANKEEFLNLDTFRELDFLGTEEANEMEQKESYYTVQLFRENKEVIEYDFKKTKTAYFSGIIAEIIADLIQKKYLKQNMKLVVVTDNSLAKKYNLSLLVIDVDRAAYRIGKFNLAERMKSETIIETVIDIAQEIGREGREGKKVGTLFVIGDEEELKQYSRQLIMNPFKGYDKSFLNIVDNKNLRETIKNFAQLDGAFLVDNEGCLRSAGTYLDVDTSNVKAYQGWGTKHLAATAISNATNSVSVLVSESGGFVKVFKAGKLILRLR